MKQIKILAVLILLIMFGINTASAIDMSVPFPMSIGYSYTSDFTTTSYGNGLNGTVDEFTLNDGIHYSRTEKLYNGINIIGATGIPGSQTIIFADAAGNIGMINTVGNINYQAYGAGVPSWYGSGAANNEMYKLTVFGASTNSKKFAVDSSGNVYTHNGMIIKKFVAPGYSEQTLYDSSGDVACTGTLVTCNKFVIGLQVDSTGKIHALISSQGSHVTGFAADGGQVVHLILNSAGTKISSELIQSNSDTSPPTGFTAGSLIIDLINPTQNYTYMFVGDAGTFIYHNSSVGTIDVGGGALTISGTDMNYKNYILYVASQSSNLIKNYATNYEGYGVAFGAGSNPDGITGTFSWRNGYGDNINTITPGAALAYRWTIDNTQTNYSNYDYFAAWGTSKNQEPADLRDLTNLYQLSSPAVFPTSSNSIAGSTIYGYLLAKNKITGSWSKLYNPVILTISGAVAGYDSITLDKAFYNLTADTITPTFTYKDGVPWFYDWAVCSRNDCNDGNIFTPMSLAGFPATSSKVTTGLPQGQFYAVMTKHLPFMANTIVASQLFEIRPPVIGVSWDKSTYNLLPKGAISSCLDSTPSLSYFTTINGYAGLQKGFLSCQGVPASANANNSIMRASLYAKYTGTFYLNNSWGSIWNGTLTNGSGALVYVLTNTSTIGQWAVTGVNASGETYSATAQVNPEDPFGYSISISPNPAYNLQTLYLTFHRPIYKLGDYVYLMDAGGQILVQFDSSAASGTYYIDPSKQYTYGTWTAVWDRGSQALGAGTGTTATVKVINSGAPKTNASIIPPEQQPGGKTGSDIATLLGSNFFWAFIFTFGAMAGTAVLVTGRGSTQDAVLPSVIVGFFGLSVFTWILWIPISVWASIVLIAIVTFAWQRAKTINTGSG